MQEKLEKFIWTISCKYIAHTPNSFYTCTCKHWFWRFLVVLCVISVAVRKVKARIRLVHFTPVVDKILCTKNGGTQISMVLTQKRWWKAMPSFLFFSNPKGYFGSTSSYCTQGLDWQVWLAIRSKTTPQDLKTKIMILYTFHINFYVKTIEICTPPFFIHNILSTTCVIYVC